MPIGILGSLAICTVIYIAFSGVLTGLMHYSQLDTPKPVATALETYPTLSWLKHVGRNRRDCGAKFNDADDADGTTADFLRDVAGWPAAQVAF